MFKYNVLVPFFYINPRDEFIPVGKRMFPQFRMKPLKVGEANSMAEAKKFHPAPILEEKV